MRVETREHGRITIGPRGTAGDGEQWVCLQVDSLRQGHSVMVDRPIVFTLSYSQPYTALQSIESLMSNGTPWADA